MVDTTPELAQYQSDHDLLIELRTEFRGMREDIKGLKDSNDTISDDHEQRIRALERQQWTIGGAASAVGIIAGYIWSLFT
jgi:hypothetical protein